MNRIQRQAITTVGLLAVVLAPMTALAQRGGNGQRSPIFAAVTFHSPGEPKLGMELAEALRARMVRFFPLPPKAGQLRVLTGAEIAAQLTGAGYPADSAITTTDLRDLGKTVGADETLEGTVKRTAAGVEARARFYSLNNISAAEVLPVVIEKDANAAGRKIAELYVQARKELPDYERCKNGLINREVDAAIAAAKAALLQYDKGVLPRACLMAAYFELQKTGKMPIDSVMRVGLEIMTIDPDNVLAVGTLADAYRLKGDTAKAIELNMKLYQLDPSNTSQAQTIIQILAQSGAPDKALTIVNALLSQNPGDASIIETRWKLLQATNQWKAALAAGEEMIKFDSSKADTTYFRRQIGNAINDSQPQLVLQLLGRVTAKFPKDARLWLAYSQELRRQGQMQQALAAAKRALAADPNIDNGYVTVLYLFVANGQADSAMAFGKQALAATPDSAGKAAIGAGLLTLISPAMTRAQAADGDSTVDAAQKRTNWEEVYRMSATIDSLVPQTSTAFFMSFSAYNIASGILGTPVFTEAQKDPKSDKTKACSELKYATDMITVVDLNMARGGRFNPQAAAQLLTAVSTQIKPYLASVKTALKCM